MPVDPNHKPDTGDGNSTVNHRQYQRPVRRLIYLPHTRPDKAFAVSLVSQFMHTPSVDHMEAVNRILRYLKSGLDKGILYKKREGLEVKAYTNSSWLDLE